MRICHIGVFSYQDEKVKTEGKSIGGIAGYIYDLIEYSITSGYKIDFVGKIYNNKSDGAIHYYQVQEKLTSTNSFLIHLFLKSFKIMLDEETIIHAHRPDHLAVFSMFKKNKSVLTIHGQQAVTVFSRKNFVIRMIYKNLEKIAIRRASKILVVDKVTFKYYSENYPKQKGKIILTPTAVNIDKFKILNREELRLKLGYSLNDKVIVYVGRVEPPKRVGDIVQAFSILLSKIPEAKLIVIGIGSELEKVRSIAGNLEILEHIHFLGMKMNFELPQWYNNADISILYSYNEGSPLSVKESLACGIPVVANRVGDIDEIIENGYNGYILDHETNESLAALMEKCLLESPNIRQNCINSVQKFSTKTLYTQISEIYKSLQS